MASLSDEELTAQVERNIAYDREQKKAIGMTGGFIGSISLDRQAILLRVKMNPDLATKDQIKLAEPIVNYTTEYFEQATRSCRPISAGRPPRTATPTT